jgi:voltage-gated potassium channel
MFIKNIEFHSEERELKFVTSTIYGTHPWNNKLVKELVFPPQLLLVMVKRKKEVIVPKGDFKLKTGDILVIGAKNFKEEKDIHLREILVKEKNPWVGMAVDELDISRQELIVMIQRKNKVIIPNGSTVIMNGDAVHIYSKKDPLLDDDLID